ncbi:hypothetical protein, partial [Klebsiella michiganensis]|uniref:hypothetical protein n=1 Tax=Klebsiella michiganensis TaxID=1134687 RepID=UPI0035D6B04C
EVWRKDDAGAEDSLPEAALDSPVRATRTQSAVNPWPGQRSATGAPATGIQYPGYPSANGGKPVARVRRQPQPGKTLGLDQ